MSFNEMSGPAKVGHEHEIEDHAALEEVLTQHVPRCPRVAVAEDDRQMREVLAWLLRDSGYEVIEAENGLGVIAALGSSAPDERLSNVDLIISDIRMPEMGGLEVLTLLRKHDRQTPIILITAFGDVPTRTQAYRLGATAVYDKPFDLDEFCRRVRQIVPSAGDSS